MRGDRGGWRRFWGWRVFEEPVEQERVRVAEGSCGIGAGGEGVPCVSRERDCCGARWFKPECRCLGVPWFKRDWDGLGIPLVLKEMDGVIWGPCGG